MSRDMTIFVDDNGKAYHIYSSEENTTLQIAELTNNYSRHTGKYIRIFPTGLNEAPVVFKNGGKYWMICSGCTRWAPNPCKLSCSKSLTSGWSKLRQIGNDIAYDTQAASILTINGTEGTTYLYVGDRWMDPGLPESKTIIFPIDFKDGDYKFDYTHSFDINLSKGVWKPITTDTSSAD